MAGLLHFNFHLFNTFQPLWSLSTQNLFYIVAMAPKTPFQEAQVSSDVTFSDRFTNTVCQAVYARATSSELSRDYSTAFNLYLSAAQSFLHLSRLVDQQVDLCKKEAAKCLARAEKIKSIKDVKKVSKDILSHGSFSSFCDLLYLIQKCRAEEQFLVLKRSSVINGLFIPPWPRSALVAPQTT